MIEFDEALKKIIQYTPVLTSELVPVEKAIGKILCENIIAKINMPPFNKSAMDGFAVQLKDVTSIPISLKCCGLIQAGEQTPNKINPKECIKIMTGAPLPKNADTVIKVEDTVQKNDSIKILTTLQKGQNICFKGEDIKVGQKLLHKGICLCSSHIALISSMGKKKIKVGQQPIVAILNTGGEIIPPGQILPPYKIYNSNGPMLSALLNSDAIPNKFLGIARDNDKELTLAIKKGLTYDILLISGGVSMGDYDLVPGILKKMGIKKIFHKVRIKPGQPLFFGVKKKTLIFGIPGNPVSNFLAYHIFILPTIKKMMGYQSFMPQFQNGLLKKNFRQKTGRKHFVLVQITKVNHQYHIYPVKCHGSADIYALSQSNGFMIIEKNQTFIKQGSKVKFFTWKKELII